MKEIYITFNKSKLPFLCRDQDLYIYSIGNDYFYNDDVTITFITSDCWYEFTSCKLLHKGIEIQLACAIGNYKTEYTKIIIVKEIYKLLRKLEFVLQHVNITQEYFE